MPAKLSVNIRRHAAAGLANNVDAVNQKAAPIDQQQAGCGDRFGNPRSRAAANRSQLLHNMRVEQGVGNPGTEGMAPAS